MNIRPLLLGWHEVGTAAGWRSSRVKRGPERFNGLFKDRPSMDRPNLNYENNATRKHWTQPIWWEASRQTIQGILKLYHCTCYRFASTESTHCPARPIYTLSSRSNAFLLRVALTRYVSRIGLSVNGAQSKPIAIGSVILMSANMHRVINRIICYQTAIDITCPWCKLLKPVVARSNQ